MNNLILTKTDFLQYLDAPRHMWAVKHGLLDESKTDLFKEHLARQGYVVEKLAKQYIEEFLIHNYSLNGNDPQIIFQPTVRTDKFEARSDILIKNPQTNKWDMYEVKSGTMALKVASTKKYIKDAIFQALIFESQYQIGEIYILHPNKEYKLDGNFDLFGFFKIDQITDKLETLRNEITNERENAYLLLQQDSYEKVPRCLNPNSCPCKKLCHHDLPKYSIFNIPNLKSKGKQKYLDMGIEDLMDLDPKTMKNENMRNHVIAMREERKIIDKYKMKEWFEMLEEPLYFLDYETYNPAVPIFQNYHSYQQITFQYSLHVLNNGELTHFEHLSTNKDGDPAKSLLQNLLTVIGDKGTILVWNQTFEKSRNKEIGELYPEYTQQMENINDRVLDLADLIRKGYYIDPKIKGRWTIKKVLPVLVPDLTYDDLTVANGTQAMTEWKALVLDESSKNKEKTKQDLLKYCELDTLAMVKIYESLRNITV